MTIFEKLTEDMKQAMKAGEKDRLLAIRLLRGQIKDAVIEKRDDLSESALGQSHLALLYQQYKI